MEPLTRAWRYLLAEPFTWVVCCFFRPTRFQKDIEIPGYFKLRRTVPMLRTSVPLLVCFFPLFCGVVVIDLRVNSLEVDIPTLSSISTWFFLGCIILSIFGGIILGIARGVTLAVVWNIVYTFAVLYTSLDIGVDTFLAMMLGFGIVGGIVFGTAFGTSNDLLGDLAGSIVWTTAVFLIRIGVGHTWSPDDLIFIAVLVGCIAGSFVWFITRNMKNPRAEKVAKKSLVWGNIWGISITIPLGMLASASADATYPVIVFVIMGYALFCFFGAAIYMLGYYRLLLYPFSCFSSLRAYLYSRIQPSHAFDYIHHCSLYWDEYVFLPLPGLKQTLLIAAQQEKGRSKLMEEIAFIIAERPQQIGTAQAVSQELAIHDLELRGDVRAISLAHKQLPMLLPQEAALIDPEWTHPFAPLVDASHDAERYLRSRNRRAKQRALQSMLVSMRRASLQAHFRDSRLNKRLDKVISTWLVAAEQEQVRLENAPFVIDQIDNPFSPGHALKPHEGLFVGRLDLAQQLEEVLRRGDRRPTLLVNGERSMGKSSLLQQLPILLGPHYLPIFYDLQRPDITSSTITFLMGVASEIYRAMKSRGIRVERLEYARLQEANKKNEANVYLRFAEWLQDVEKGLEQEDKTLLLAFDEFEIFTESEGTIYLHLGLLLNWFHSITQNHPRLALLFSGVRTFSEMGPDWVNHFANVQTLRVSFLRPAEVRRLITHPDDPDFSAQQPFSEDVVEDIIRVTACHPFMVQAVCSALIDLLNKEERTRVNRSDVNTIIDRVFDSWNIYFQDQWLRADDDQRKCLAGMANLSGCSLSQIAQYVGLGHQATGSALQNLLRRDLILSENGYYRIAVPLFCEWVRRNSSLLELETGDSSAHQLYNLSSEEVPDSALYPPDQSNGAAIPSVQHFQSTIIIPPSNQPPLSSTASTQATLLPLLKEHASQPSTRQISRRTFVGGAAGLVAMGIAGLIWFSRSKPSPSFTQPPIGTLIYIYHGQSNKIRVLAWSPDNKRIASGSDDYTAHVWDAATGNNPLIYRRHTYFVEGLAWSPDSKRIASGCADTTVQIWDPSDGSGIYTYRGHRLWVNRVSWSSNGKYIVSGEQSGIVGYPVQVHVWEASTGNTIAIYNGHTNGVFAVAWSPDSTRVASCGYDGVLQIWEGTTGKPISTYRDNVANFGLAWSPDGQRIAVACNDALVRVIDANTGNMIYAYNGHRQAAEDVAWSPDGTYIASSGGDSTVHVFNAATSRNLFTYKEQPGPLAAVAWSPDGKRIASGSDNGSVQVWYAHI